MQLDGGRFARGLWYFFGIVTTAGIFSGIAGLGIGVAAGLLWEQVHRHRRAIRTASVEASHSPETGDSPDVPRLQLVTPVPVPLPDIEGRRLAAVRFTRDVVELDFAGYRLGTAGTITVATGSARLSSQDTGWRDALCSLIGSRVDRVRAATAERFEIQFDNGQAVLMPRTSGARANEPRQINES